MPRSSVATGVVLAACAAVAFGVTTPVVAWAGITTGPLSTAALLYAVVHGRRWRGTHPRLEH